MLKEWLLCKTHCPPFSPLSSLSLCLDACLLCRVEEQCGLSYVSQGVHSICTQLSLHLTPPLLKEVFFWLQVFHATQLLPLVWEDWKGHRSLVAFVFCRYFVVITRVGSLLLTYLGRICKAPLSAVPESLTWFMPDCWFVVCLVGKGEIWRLGRKRAIKDARTTLGEHCLWMLSAVPLLLVAQCAAEQRQTDKPTLWIENTASEESHFCASQTESRAGWCWSSDMLTSWRHTYTQCGSGMLTHTLTHFLLENNPNHFTTKYDLLCCLMWDDRTFLHVHF